MKTIKDKARAYDEAFAAAKHYYELDSDTTKNVLEEIFPELKDSEDEMIRKRIIQALHGDVLDMEETTKALAWLEKQGEHANFRNKIQIGDNVTRNGDGVLVNLSQLKRVATPEITNDCEVDSNEDGLIAETIRHKKENQDEKIRKELIAYCQVNMGHTWHDIKQEDYITWLEKQGEKNNWSKEDEVIVLSIKQIINCASLLNIVPEKLDRIDKWLKSLKQRIEKWN